MVQLLARPKTFDPGYCTDLVMSDPQFFFMSDYLTNNTNDLLNFKVNFKKVEDGIHHTISILISKIYINILLH